MRLSYRPGGISSSPPAPRPLLSFALPVHHGPELTRPSRHRSGASACQRCDGRHHRPRLRAAPEAPRGSGSFRGQSVTGSVSRPGSPARFGGAGSGERVGQTAGGLGDERAGAASKLEGLLHAHHTGPPFDQGYRCTLPGIKGHAPLSVDRQGPRAEGYLPWLAERK